MPLQLLSTLSLTAHERFRPDRHIQQRSYKAVVLTHKFRISGSFLKASISGMPPPLDIRSA